MSTRARRRPYLFPIALAALAAACDSTGPDVDAVLDTDAALADYDAVEAVLTSPDWQAFRALGGRTPFGGSAAGVEAVSGLHALGARDAGRAFARELARDLSAVAAASGAPAAAPIISDTHRGATFVYDPDADRYVVDPEREGAPETGVRFVLYEVDEAGVPIPEEEIGHADLVDEGDTSAEDVALHLTVTAHERSVLDYRATLEIGVLQAQITVAGFLRSEDGVQLDFDIAARGEQSIAGGALDITFALAVESRGFSVSGTVSGVENGGEGEGDVELTVTHRHHTLDVDVTGTDGQLDGAIHLDGELFATVSGDAKSPTIVSGDGDPLTLAESLVLHRILDGVEDVFDLLEDLVDPVDELVLVGIVL